jgi:hypothetical protein
MGSLPEALAADQQETFCQVFGRHLQIVQAVADRNFRVANRDFAGCFSFPVKQESL